MIVISEYTSRLTPSASANDLRKMTETALLLGISVYYVPQTFEDLSIAEALAYVPVFQQQETAFWIGYVPSPAQYEAMYEALALKNVWLVNTPDQFRRAEEFDKYYATIAELTCRSIVAETPEEAQQAAERLGFPVFVKGTIQSFKKWGWKSCVAENATELTNLFHNLQKHTSRSLGKVILRELIPLRYAKNTPAGFPQGREFRVFMLHQQLVAYSYYWDKDDPLKAVTPAEETQILQLARVASQRIGVPYVAIDIGQKESGEWLVIEAGDAQFSGICQISPIMLWQRVQQVLG